MRCQLRDDGRAGRMNPGSPGWHVGASNESLLSQQSGTEGNQATRTSNTSKHVQTRTKSSVSKSIRRDDDDDGHYENRNSRFAHAEASNVRSSSSSRIRPSTTNIVAGKDDNEATPHSELMGRNLRANQAGTKTRSEPNVGSCPQPSRPSPGQSNTGSTPLQVNATRNGDKRKKSLRSMDRVAGFDGGPSTVSARSSRRSVQRETGAVPVPVPGKGTRPNLVESTSTSAVIELGKSKENGQANQVSRSPSFVGVDGHRRPTLHWGKKEKKPPKPVLIRVGTTDKVNVDKDALYAERQKKVAALKKITFSKKAKEVKEEEDILRIVMDTDGIGDSERGRKESAGGGEGREAEANEQVGEEILEQVPPQREHSPWTLDGQGNIPGLSATSRSARIHGPYNLPQSASVVNVETEAVPIPLPSLFSDPPDSVSDSSDEDLYLPKEVEKTGVDAASSQVKEEHREDEDVFFDSLVPGLFPDLQTPISAPIPDITIDLEQNTADELSTPVHADDSASYPLDTECTIHPKTKRKQHNISHTTNARSPKKVKTDVRALEGQSESHTEVVRVQEDEDETSHASVPAPKKRGRPPKKRKKKEKDVVIDQAETHVVTIGREEPLTEMEICAVETKRGEVPTSDALTMAASGAVSTAGPSDCREIEETTTRKESESTGENAESAEQDKRVMAETEISALLLRLSPPSLAGSGAVSTDGPSDPQTRIGETTGRTESESTGENAESAEQDKHVMAEIEISATPSTGPLPASGSAHEATRVEPSAPDSGIIRSGKKGRRKGRATGEVRKGKRNGRGQTTEAGERAHNHDVNSVGDQEIPHPDETPSKKRKAKDQATEGIECGPEAGASLAGDGEEPHPNETPRKRTKMDDQTIKGGERTEGDLAGDGHIPQQETPREQNDQTTEGGERMEGGPAGDEHIPQQQETPREQMKINDQTMKDGEGLEGPAGDEHIPQQEEMPKKRRKKTHKKTEGGENIQDSSAGSAAADDIARPYEGPKEKGKATDQITTEGAIEAEKKVVRRGRPSKEKKNDEDTNGETSLVKVTEEMKEVKGNTRGRKKRASMDEKDGTTDGAVRKKKRVKLAVEEGGRQSGKTVKSTVKWMLVCKNKAATGRKASRQGKGKEKAQSNAMAPDVDVDENEETEGNVKTLRPSIWASSKTELLLVLPELSGSKCFNGITEGSSNLPMVMLDESTAESICVDVRWFDDEEGESSEEIPSIRLTLARDFVCPVAESVSTGGTLVDSGALSDARPSSVVTRSNVSSSAIPGPSSVLNAYRNGCEPPVVLAYDDNDGMDLEYIDEDAPQGGAAATISVATVNMSPISLTPIMPHPPSVAQEATTTAHISHKMQSCSQAPALPTLHPAIQFSSYNPTNLFTPSTVSIPSLQIQHLLPFQKDQIPFPQWDTTAPVPIPIPTQIPIDDEQPAPPKSELKSELDTIIPPSPPPEIEILTSSQKLSLPLILISSHETFKRYFWGPLKPPLHSNGPGDSQEQAEKVGLAAEHAFVFLGFFRVVKTGQRRVTLSDEERINLRPVKVAGRIEWTFDVEWLPGYHGSKGGEELNRPWWAPDFVFGRPVGRKRGSEKEFTWLEKHAQARLNLLPMQLVDGQEAGSSDEAMPKGWFCKACGKLNQKVMMRHRWCGGRICRDNPLSRGYAVDLSSARDANQTPLALPINTYNRRTVDASVADWDDGMRTLEYRPMSILGGILQHVFTCNLVDLQTEATSLFERIQSEVCLMKNTGDSGPFFKSHISNSYANKREKYAFSCMSWSEAPKAVREARDLMTFMGKMYAEEETLDIDRLTIVGWVSSGARKTPMILAAREHAIAMLCLGNDVVLTIVPKWEVSAPVPGALQVQQSSNLSYPPDVPPFAPFAEMVDPVAFPSSISVLPRVANFTPPKIQTKSARTPRPIKPPSTDQMQLVGVAAAPAIENHVQQVGAISENPSGVDPAQITTRSSRSKPASKLKPKPKQASESMSVTLVHGDMLLFSGCDFEYTIKRMGTSILVIGNKEDSTASI